MLPNDFPARDPGARYFFVHIPKTGGTSLFNWLCRVYGGQNCCEHIETIVLPAPNEDAMRFLTAFQVIAGHIPIDWWCYFADAGYAPITVIRNPIDQFFSHANHLLSQAEDVSGDAFLSGIIAKLKISTGYFLEHGDADELDYFESPQSKTVLGGTFPWRAHSMPERLSWLKNTYAAVLLTETMGSQLTGRVPDAAPGDDAFPRINVRFYNRSRLDSQQRRVLLELLREDIALYRMVRTGLRDN